MQFYDNHADMKIKSPVNFDNLQLSKLDKDDVINLAKAIDGFLSSDVGKMTQAVVFASFPEMKVAKDVAMPVLREFIKKVSGIIIHRLKYMVNCELQQLIEKDEICYVTIYLCAILKFKNYFS